MRTELKELQEEMWKMKSKVVGVVTGALGAVTSRFQERRVQKSAVQGTANILQRNRKVSGLQ